MNSLMSMIFALPTIFLIRKVGIDTSIKIAMVLTAVGFVVRMFLNFSIHAVMIGQLLIGIGYPTILMIQTNFITLWFNDKDVIFQKSFL